MNPGSQSILPILLALCIPLSAARAAAPAGSSGVLALSAKDLKPMANDALELVKDAGAEGGQAVKVLKNFKLEAYAPLNEHIHLGVYRLTLRVKTDDRPAGRLNFALWNPYGTPGMFRYQTAFSAEEYAPAGKWTDLSRTFLIGPQNGNYGMALDGGWPGLEIQGLRLEPVRTNCWLMGVMPDKLLYRLNEPITLQVSIFNAMGRKQTAHLRAQVESGLDERAVAFDKDVEVGAAPGPGQPTILAIPLPAQSEYGHSVTVELLEGGKATSARHEYFYVSDHPVRIGHLGAMGMASNYGSEDATGFVASMRQHYFPMYELLFWAPDDATMLMPPPGKDRWWSGQTLAQVGTESIKRRVELGHQQGMKVLAYTDLRYCYGFRVAEYFRLHPECCDWDCNDIPLAYDTWDIRRQLREDDAERFGPDKKPRFEAAGIWKLVTENPQVIDDHIHQLVEAAKFFDLDGYRYDDAYQYDQPLVDMLGRQLPVAGLDNSVILSRLRGALEKVNGGLIYGHNMEWSQNCLTEGPPMPIDAKPYRGDYYTELVRDDALALQERWTAYMLDQHERWSDIAENVFRTGYNAFRWGGHAYLISRVNNCREQDGKLLTALILAGYGHIAYDVSDQQVGYMRLACRFCDLLYANDLVPIIQPENLLSVDGGKPLWWKRYVRYRQTAPGRRVYVANLINPPANERIGTEGAAPQPLESVKLQWHLPAGWKALKAYQISPEGGGEVTTVAGCDRVGYDLVQHPLAITQANDAVSMESGRLINWSMIAVECQGPADQPADVAMAQLPPRPPGDLPTAQPKIVTGDHSPNALAMVVYDAARPWLDVHQKPSPTIADDGATGHLAVLVRDPLQFEAYMPGERIRGGLYRMTLRLKSSAAPPKGAKVTLSAWCPAQRPNAWRVSRDVPLVDLTPQKGWQTYSWEVEMGYGWENFGMQVAGGFNGLLVDSVSLEELKPYPELKRLQLQNGKPWPTDLQLTPHQGLKVWYGQGLFSEHYQISQALKKIDGVKLDEASHYVYRETRGFGSPVWKTPQELAAYDLIVLANVDLRTLSLEQRDWLAHYVDAGGALWLAGGPYGFGRGYWQESDLLEPIIPVQMHAFDLRPQEKPAVLRAGDGAIANGIDFGDAPAAIWLHEVLVKPKATVSLWAENHPALVTWTAGRGRVAVLLVTPLGPDGQAVHPFWKWAGWQGLMEQTGRWLLNK